MINLNKFLTILDMDLSDEKTRKKVTLLYEELDHDIKTAQEAQDKIKAYLLKYMDAKGVKKEGNGSRTWIAVDRNSSRVDKAKVESFCKSIGKDADELKVVIHSHYFQLGK